MTITHATCFGLETTVVVWGGGGKGGTAVLVAPVALVLSAVLAGVPSLLLPGLGFHY